MSTTTIYNINIALVVSTMTFARTRTNAYVPRRPSPPKECWEEVRCCGPRAGLAAREEEEPSMAESAMERMMVSSAVVL